MTRRILVGALVVGILLGAAAILGRVLGGGTRARFPSRFAAEPEGLLAFARLLESLGRPVESRTRPWDDLGAGRAAGLLLVATPLRRPVDAREAAALRRWLVKGGALLVIDDATAPERPLELEKVLEEAGLRARAPLPEIDPATLMFARPRTRVARGTSASPSGTDLRRIILHAEGGLYDDAGGVPLALGRSGEVLAAEGSIGAGRVVRVQGPLLANDQVLAGDNLVLALRLVDDLRGEDAIVFDEYHHGYGGLLPSVRGLDPAALAWAGLQALLTAALYALSRGVRFGSPRPSPEPPRRSSLEFVRSMASLYRTAGARRHVIESALSRFLREARTRWGVGEALSIETLARSRAMRSAPVPERRIVSSLEAAQHALFKDNLGDRDMLARARDLARLEEEVFGGR